jgi:putative ABC transport system permease protein
MKNYKQLGNKYVKMKKGRTTAIIVTNILAIALVTFFWVYRTASFNEQINQITQITGNYHAVFENLGENQIKILKEDPRIIALGENRSGTASIIEGTNVNLNLQYMDEEALKIVNIELLEGDLPKNYDEIVIEKDVAERLGLNEPLGKEIRVINLSNRSNIYTLTISGIIKETYASVDLALISESLVEEISKEAVQSSTVVLVTYKDPKKMEEITKDIARSLRIGEDDYYLNKTLQSTIELYGGNSLPTILLTILIVSVAITAIYNILNISVLERIREFGRIRAIGATPTQVRRIIFREASMYALISIPIGIILGIVLPYLFLPIFGLTDLAKNIQITTGIIIGSAFVGIISIYISSFLPARKTQNISPMEAIRITEKLKTNKKNKRRKEHKWTEKAFGITGKIASQDMESNIGQTRKTLVSITLLVTLFVSIAYITSSFDPLQAATKKIKSDYLLVDERFFADGGFSDETLEEVKNIEGVKEVKGLKVESKYPLSFDSGVIDELYLNQDYMDEFQKEWLNRTGEYLTSIYIFSYSDEMLEECNEYLLEGKIDIEKLKNGNYVIVEYNDKLFNEDISLDNYPLKVGDEIELIPLTIEGNVEELSNYPKLEIVALIEEVPYYLHDSNPPSPMMIVSEETFNKLSNKKNYSQIYINLDEDADRTYVENQLNEIATSKGSWEVVSFRNVMEDVEKFVNTTVYILYIFGTVIFFISISSIANSISTNILTRTTQYGILRAVGLNEKNLRKMMMIEGFLFSAKGGIWGIIVGSIVGIFWFAIMAANGAYIKFMIPWLQILLIFVVTILCGMLITLIPFNRLKKTSIIESIRDIEQ